MIIWGVPLDRIPEDIRKAFGTHILNVNTNNGELNKELVALIEQGAPIQAIKRYREITNCDLKTAKEYVDRLRDSGT